MMSVMVQRLCCRELLGSTLIQKLSLSTHCYRGAGSSDARALQGATRSGATTSPSWSRVRLLVPDQSTGVAPRWMAVGFGATSGVRGLIGAADTVMWAPSQYCSICAVERVAHLARGRRSPTGSASPVAEPPASCAGG